MGSQYQRKLAAPGFLNKCASKCRSLFFSTLLAFPLISHPSVSQALPKSNPAVNLEKTEKLPTVRKSPVRRQSVSCRFEKGVLEYAIPNGPVKKVDKLLDRGEAVLDLACHDRYAFVITNTSLIVVPGRQEKDKSGNVEVIFRYTKKDIREMHKKGIVSWAYAQDKCFFLARDGEITEVPVIVKSETIPFYKLPFDFQDSAMVFHQGFLLIAPALSRANNARVMVVVKLANKKSDFSELALPQGLKDADFFYSGKKLFFGNKGSVELEIKILGTDPSSVKMKKRK